MGALILVLALANVAGQRDYRQWVLNPWRVQCNHGWPFPFLTRDAETAYQEQNRPEANQSFETNLWMVREASPTPREIGIWSLTAGCVEMRWWSLVGNLAVSVGLVVVLWRLWIRHSRFSGRLRFSLRGMLVAVLIVGLALGWCTKLRDMHQANVDAAKFLQEPGGRVTWVPETVPDCVLDLLGDDLCRPFFRVAALSVWTDESHAPTSALLLQRLAALHGLRVLFAQSDFVEKVVDQLKTLEPLEVVELNDLESSDAALKRLRAALPHLEFREGSHSFMWPLPYQSWAHEYVNQSPE